MQQLHDLQPARHHLLQGSQEATPHWTQDHGSGESAVPQARAAQHDNPVQRAGNVEVLAGPGDGLALFLFNGVIAKIMVIVVVKRVMLKKVTPLSKGIDLN